MKNYSLVLIFMSLVGAASGISATAMADELSPLELPGVREQHLWIPMRDGIELSAYLYLPDNDDRKWPAVFEQRYADITGVSTRKNSAELARHGYAVVMVNYRGTHQSEGR